ncbi:MAG: hypothetical protein KDK65_00405 [Chlamydiia bacterium]|nr:hypothetical protein [Chlamydiia bacterium]
MNDKTKDDMAKIEEGLKEQKCDPKTKKMIKESLEKIFVEGKDPYEAIGLTVENLENMYGHAYKKFQAGNYTEAEIWFRFLHRMNRQDPRFLLGLGGCYHMRKEFLQAIVPYLKAFELDDTQALPLFYLADCFLNLENKRMAATTIDLIIILFGPNPLYSHSIERYKLIRENLGPAFTIEDIEKEAKEAQAYLKKPVIEQFKQYVEKDNDSS